MLNYIRRDINEVVTAIQFTGDNIKQCVNFAGKHIYLTHDHEKNKIYVLQTLMQQNKLYQAITL